ncbi:hypothetical protein BDY21DRAFT_190455 [Lineolata rhizophorae]|uniref:Uncharacterized protein n=1 Tax=Lineolata rhizophorae TaxID=578093 RepID=A0A6A6P6J0_9PEZI|nr:hypothetical protein BDY21DRAFT_190455 [Lineolata rhizophorae]
MMGRLNALDTEGQRARPPAGLSPGPPHRCDLTRQADRKSQPIPQRRLSRGGGVLVTTTINHLRRSRTGHPPSLPEGTPCHDTHAFFGASPERVRGCGRIPVGTAAVRGKGRRCRFRTRTARG